LRLVIHRGAKEIGGSCVEITAESGSRLLLDMGMPLARPDGSEWPKGTALRPSQELQAEGLLPNINGFYADEKPSIDGLVLSHSHIDHYGLAHHIHPRVPAFGTPGTLAILRASRLFVPDAAIPASLRELRADIPAEIGSFLVTAIPVDHSAPDSCALRVEADGQTVLYSGDLRAHGPHGSLFDRVSRSCAAPDVLILEGTTVGQPVGSHGFPTETDVKETLTELLCSHDGLVVLAASGQNADRLVSAYEACRTAGRQIVIDPYQAYILHVLAPLCKDLPQFGSPGVRVKFVHSQVTKLIEAGQYGLACAMSKASKISKDQLIAEPGSYLLMARSNQATVALLSRLTEPANVAVVWSMWKGYWERNNPLKTFCAAHGIEPRFIHSGGHAHPEDLLHLVGAVHPRVVVPIHTQSAAAFADLIPRVIPIDDGVAAEVSDLILGAQPAS
jgi:ribonuclease J